MQDSGGGADGRQEDPGPTPVISRRHRVECISVGSPKNPPKSSTRRGSDASVEEDPKVWPSPVILGSVQTSKGRVTWELVQALPKICRESRDSEEAASAVNSDA